MEKDVHANGNQKGARVAIFISEKVDFKSKLLPREKKKEIVMIKVSIHREDLTIKYT